MTALVPVADVAPTGSRSVDDVLDRSARVTGAAARALSGSSRGLQAWTVAADVTAVLLGAILLDMSGTRLSPAAVLALAALWVALLAATQSYRPDPDLGVGRRARSVLRAAAALGIVFWVTPVLIEAPASPRDLIALTGVLTTTALAQRAVTDGRSALARRTHVGSVLVAGSPDAVAAAVAEIRRSARPRWRVAMTCVTEQPAGHDLDSVPVTLGVDDLEVVAAAAGVDAVLVIPCPELDPWVVRRLGWHLEETGTSLYVGAGLLDVAAHRAALVTAGDLAVVRVRRSLRPGPGRAFKAVAERVGAALLLVALAPLLAAIALAVKCDSPGPAIFRQRRVGQDGREFTMYKYRTMSADAERLVDTLLEHNESEGAVLFKIRADPRITRVGRLLRRYSLDELPQLVNVVLGEMSIVGPRPALPHEVARYDRDPRRRLAVRPGLTGLWQVSGRSDLSWEETVRLDLHYVDNWSLALDLGILVRTARAVFGHSGAY